MKKKKKLTFIVLICCHHFVGRQSTVQLAKSIAQHLPQYDYEDSQDPKKRIGPALPTESKNPGGAVGILNVLGQKENDKGKKRTFSEMNEGNENEDNQQRKKRRNE
jgi:hypothetical protein